MSNAIVKGDRPLVLDLFCCAGGISRGAQDAGFVAYGVDIAPQRHYIGDWFYQGDALEFLRRLIAGETVGGLTLADVDAIHASPPCQEFTPLKAVTGKSYPDLIEPARQLLNATGKPWVMENVPTAPLRATLFLCGTMFPELRVIRHRIFEFGNMPPVWQPPRECNHWGTTSGANKFVAGKRKVGSFDDYDFLTVTGHDFKVADGRIAMGIDWMVGNELREAIPPAYGAYVFAHVRAHLGYA